MQWKLLTAFVAAFTVVFAFIAFWVVNYASDVALKRLTGQLLEATEGAARDLPAKAVAEVAALDPDQDPTEDSSYQRIKDDIDSVRATIPSVEPYTYIVAGRQVVLPRQHCAVQAARGADRPGRDPHVHA